MSRGSRSTAAVVAIMALLVLVAGFTGSRGAVARPLGGGVVRCNEAGAVVKARIKLSRQALDAIRRAKRDGASALKSRTEVYRWSRRLLGDRLYASSSGDEPRVTDPEAYFALPASRTNPERLAAFEEHFQRMEELEASMRPLCERRILTALEFLEVQAYRLEAELWLARERAKDSGSLPMPGIGH